MKLQAVLRPVKDVEIREDAYLALSNSPWLRLDFNGPIPAGCWIELTYAASLFDPLVRPVVRCFTGKSYYDEILPGALFGRAIWLGPVPRATRDVWISP